MHTKDTLTTEREFDSMRVAARFLNCNNTRPDNHLKGLILQPSARGTHQLGQTPLGRSNSPSPQADEHNEKDTSRSMVKAARIQTGSVQ
jgi:hypothetical protein